LNEGFGGGGIGGCALASVGKSLSIERKIL